MNRHEKMLRVSRHHPCPICGRPDWCGFIGDSPTEPEGVVCMRVESRRPARNGGWVHWLRPGSHSHERRHEIILPAATTPVPPAKIAAMARCFAASAENGAALPRLADELGVTASALRRFGVGVCWQQSCSTWPMTDDKGRVIGINRRFRDGSKKLFFGHKAGLYLPGDLPMDLSGQTLLICEGGSDAVAGLSLGYWSVGRFSCSAGADFLRRLVRARRPHEVVIFADGDGPGLRGAEALAVALLPHVARLKLLEPPERIKDLRAWLKDGLTFEELRMCVAKSPYRRLTIEVEYD
ncbi:MAG: hypothetical protein JXL80_18320 [Planctomycetes bacterium]|nr:hypothetical protein [Planctomycetota bacterium]